MAKNRKVYTAEERCMIVKMIHRGASVDQVVEQTGVPKRCLFRWMAWYRQGGWGALQTDPRSGAPRKINDQAMKWLYEAVTMGNPRQYQLDFSLWTLQLMRQLLKQKFNIVVSLASVSRLMAQMGLSPQRPIYRSYKRDPKRMETYLGKTFPELQEHARKTGAVIYFVDEAAARSDNHHGRTWSPCGVTPVVSDSGSRFSLRLISAVSARGEMRFSVIEATMNSERFLEFICKLRKDVGKPLIVICDNARYHTSKKTREGAEKEDVQLCFLPPYSPEVNPDEQVWNHLKRRLGQCFIGDKMKMKKQCMRIMRSIQKTKSLICSFFKLAETRYAAAVA